MRRSRSPACRASAKVVNLHSATTSTTSTARTSASAWCTASIGGTSTITTSTQLASRLQDGRGPVDQLPAVGHERAQRQAPDTFSSLDGCNRAWTSSVRISPALSPPDATTAASMSPVLITTTCWPASA